MANARTFVTRKCTDPGCGLRFPIEAGSSLGDRCPKCGAPTQMVDLPYQTRGAMAGPAVPTVEIEVLLDNVRSLRNVGSMFRTADGAGVRHLHLGGVTPTPAHPKLAKTALGAESSVPWTHYRDAAAAAAELAGAGRRLWAIEGGTGGVSLFDPGLKRRAELGPVVLAVGHEVSGLDPRIRRLCERTLFIPMLGIKGSLNVSVALGVALYTLRFG